VDVADMYRRLPIVEGHLRGIGLLAHWPRVELPGVDPRGPVAGALLTVASVVEPVKVYQRGALQPDIGQLQPLNELADWALPESRPAREFAAALEQWLFADGALSPAAAEKFAARLETWRAAGELAATAPVDDSPRAQARAKVARTLAALCRTTDEAIAALLAGRATSSEWNVSTGKLLAAARPNAAAVEFPFLPALRKLAAAAADPAAREKLSRAEWRRRIESTPVSP
jgi:hexosaminidase